MHPHNVTNKHCPSYPRSRPAKDDLRVPPRQLRPAGHQELDGDLPEGPADLPAHGELPRLPDQDQGLRLQVVPGAAEVQHGDVPLQAGLAAEGLRPQERQGAGQVPGPLGQRLPRSRRRQGRGSPGRRHARDDQVQSEPGGEQRARQQFVGAR